MTERSGNTPPPPASSPAPELDDATVVIAQPSQAVQAEAEPISPELSTPPPPSPLDSSVAIQGGTVSPLTASMTRPALARVKSSSSRSPLWAIVLGALSGLLLFALTAALLMNR